MACSQPASQPGGAAANVYHTLCFSYFCTMNAALALSQLQCPAALPSVSLCRSMCNCRWQPALLRSSLLLSLPPRRHLLLTINLKNEFPLKMPHSHRCVLAVRLYTYVCVCHTHTVLATVSSSSLHSPLQGFVSWQLYDNTT